MIVTLAIIILSYLVGCFSAARFVAKTFKSLNLDKVGTGYSDTENIYYNVSKKLGLLTGFLDMAKIYIFLFLLKLALMKAVNYEYLLFTMDDTLFIAGMAQLTGHCLPFNKKFKGGRGIFTYLGFSCFFAFYPTLAVGFFALLFVFYFKQMRFAQFSVVLLPPLFIQLTSTYFPQYATGLTVTKFIFAAFFMGILNFVLSKRLGEL